MGLLSPDGSIKSGKTLVGCANLDNEVLNRDGFVIGYIMDKTAVYDKDGKFVDNMHQNNYNEPLIPNTKILFNKLLVNSKKEIKGIILIKRA